LFIRIDLEKNLASNLERIPGAANLVNFGGDFSDVPDHLLNAIRVKVDEINSVGGQKKAALEAGTLVKIEKGPFEGYEGIVDERIPGKERVRVLLNFLQNRKLAVDLPANYVNAKRKPSPR
jgi:transcription antitermination factor NusG